MPRVYTLRELKESKLMFDRKPPAFGVVIILIILAFLIGSIVFAAFSVKTYVVRGTGIVVSEERANIMNRVPGSISNIYVSEGAFVSAGDVLMELDDIQLRAQITQIQSTVDLVTRRMEVTEQLIRFINAFSLDISETRVNPFSSEEIIETRVFADAQTFIDYVKKQEEDFIFSQDDVDDLKDQFLGQQYGVLEDLHSQLIQHSSQLVMYKENQREYLVIAEKDGIVSLSSDLTIGTVIQAGVLLGTIDSSNNSTFVIEAVISAHDRNKVTVGDTVEIAVAGISQNEFGVLQGEIVIIANNSTQTENGDLVFRVIVKPFSTVLSNDRGNEIRISVGQVVENRIKYDESTWLSWIIDQIGVRLR